MLGISAGLLANSGAGNIAGNHEREVAVVGSIKDGLGDEDRGRDEEGDRNSVGNRWPRQETLALLKIRSDMDVAFRDSSLKAPLWDEVSRKLAELGYHRSAKKCKEKFENVYKYHRRTKEGRSSRPDGKAYRFFDQLEAFHNQQPSLLPEKNQTPTTTTTTTTMTIAMPAINPTIAPQNNAPSFLQNLTSTSTASSSSSSEEESEGIDRKKKRRKMGAFFDKLMKVVVEKQESLQKKFVEAIEKREHDRMVREEAWKMQEMVRINREHEVLVQERSIAAAKDAAVIAFLQKISSGQSNPVQLQENSSHSDRIMDNPLSDSREISIPGLGSHEKLNFTSSSSRWPKGEVQALIKLRTSLDLTYQETGPKGSLWEEISSAMKKLGYDRSSKRCKEKWENINKYFKRVKENNKRRPEDSKTCPYFHQLDALYQDKTKKNIDKNSFNQTAFAVKAKDLVVQQTMRNVNQEEDGDDEDQAENEGGGYEIVTVTNNPSSLAI